MASRTLAACPSCGSPWPRSTPTVGDLAGNVELVVARRARPPRPAPTSSRSPRWCSPATRSRTSRCAPRSSDASRAALDALARGWRPRAWRPPGRGRLPRPAEARRRRRSAAAPARRRTPRRPAPAAGSSRATPSTTCPTTASSTSTATSCPATRRRWCGCSGVDVAAGDLRGPLAGRRPGRRGAGGRRRPARGDQRLAVRARTRTTCGSTWCAAAPARPGARSPTSTWSAARTSWSSTATRSSSTPTARLGRGPRSSPRTLLVADLELPAAGRRRRRAVPVASTGFPLPTYERPRRARAAVAARISDDAEVWGRWSRACATMCARTASARSCSGSPAASTRRWSRRSRCDAVGADNVHGVSMPSLYSSEHSRTTRPRWPSARDCTCAPSRSRRWSTRSRRSCRSPVWPRRTCRPGCAARLSWRSPTRRGTSCSRPVTRASSPWATPRSTATRWAASRRSRTCRSRRVAARALAQRRGEARGRDAADPGEQHRQAAVGGAASGPARHRLAARLPGARRPARRLRRERPGAAELVADGFDPALVDRVLRLTDVAEYKRRQYPPGTKISVKGFGRDRRLPVTNKWRETAD